MSRPLVAIVGRPNVGKSMLFNKLCGQRLSIVEDTPGVTRDRLYAECEWCGRTFDIVDTGGIEPSTDNEILLFMREQAMLAIDAADVIILVTEIGTGVTAADQEVANLLLRSKKPVVLAVNKMDSTGAVDPGIYEFYSLGLGDPIAVSAVHGHGTGDLLDACLEHFPPENADDDEPDRIRVAVIGKPNVGKSSLVNLILGEKRVIVSNVAGTTRDAVDTRFENQYGKYVFVDTAGIRKKNKVQENLEFYSVMRSIRAIEHSDVCIMMIDATTGMEAQDMNIFNLIKRNRKGCVIVVNKWDLFEKDSNTLKEYTEGLRARIAPFNDVPIIFTSVLKKQRILDVMNEIAHVYENYSRRLSTSSLMDTMLPEIENYPPPMYKGKVVKIKYITQLPTKFPAFAFFCNLPQYIKDPYKRFLENKLRSHFDLTGCPIQILIRQK